ncbi:MAG: FHA domain-containing protein [Xanthomonadales bacterium]|nr:FHA domain-containing protein [Xanthomonadales bacterium]
MSVYKLKGTSGSVINQSFPFGESIVLGSSTDCDIQLDEAGVSPRHAEICLLDGNSLQLRDLASESGTLLNGEPVSETLLGSGDEIRIGTCRWMLQAPGLRPERILTTEVVSKPVRRWPRVLIWTSLAGTAAAVAILKWKPEWLEYLRSLL